LLPILIALINLYSTLLYSSYIYSFFSPNLSKNFLPTQSF